MADLVFPRIAVTIFSAYLHHVQSRALALGSEPYRLSLDQYSSPRDECVAVVVVVGTAASARRLAGGRHFRLAPCSSRVGCLDHRAKKRADGFFLFAHAARVDAVYRCTGAAIMALLSAGPRFLCAGALGKIDSLHAARGAIPDFVAAKETN